MNEIDAVTANMIKYYSALKDIRDKTTVHVDLFALIGRRDILPVSGDIVKSFSRDLKKYHYLIQKAHGVDTTCAIEIYERAGQNLSDVIHKLGKAHEHRVLLGSLERSDFSDNEIDKILDFIKGLR